MSKIEEVAAAVESGKSKIVGGLVQEAIDEGCDPTEILNKGMIDAMGVVGEKFKNGEIFVPEMLVAARAMKKGVEVLKPHLAAGAAGANGKIILGTVAIRQPGTLLQWDAARMRIALGAISTPYS